MNLQIVAKKRGFTLIELLVVIAIIGILSSVVLASLNSARKKARDARRLSDLRQFQTALEFYYESHGDYPGTTNQFATDCNPQQYDPWGDVFNVLVTEGFLPSLPHDPRYPSSNPWCYHYYKNYALDCTSSITRPYILLFGTEDTVYNLPSHSNLEGAKGRYCLTP